MARAFTPREKLALSLTSAGSMRNLGALLGVSHQRIGRWLREGEPGGVRSIPSDALPLIDLAFDLHRDISKAQARAVHLPYTADAPVFVERPRMRRIDRTTGERQQGERMIVPRTAFLGRELRERVIASMQQSGQFVAVSVRSLANLYHYLGIQKRFAETQSGRRIFKLSMLNAFRAREIDAPGSNARAPISTKKENISPGTDVGIALEGIRQKMRQKHEPFTDPGDLGTELFFQTTYRQFETFGAPKPAPVSVDRKRTKRRSKSGIRDRR